MKVTIVHRARGPDSLRNLLRTVTEVTSHQGSQEVHPAEARPGEPKSRFRKEWSLRRLAQRSRLSASFAKQANHFLVESWNVIWFPAGYQAMVVDDFLVDPVRARIL